MINEQVNIDSMKLLEAHDSLNLEVIKKALMSALHDASLDSIAYGSDMPYNRELYLSFIIKIGALNQDYKHDIYETTKAGQQFLKLLSDIGE